MEQHELVRCASPERAYRWCAQLRSGDLVAQGGPEGLESITQLPRDEIARVWLLPRAATHPPICLDPAALDAWRVYRSIDGQMTIDANGESIWRVTHVFDAIEVQSTQPIRIYIDEQGSVTITTGEPPVS